MPSERKTWKVGEYVFHLGRTGALTIHRGEGQFLLASAPGTLEVLADEMRVVAQEWRELLARRA